MPKTINISINEKDLERIDAYCLAHNLTRSKFMLQATIQALEVEDLVNSTNLLFSVLDKFQKTGMVDEEDAKKVGDMERLLQLIGGRKYGV